MTGSEEEWPKRRRGEECGDDLESRVGLLQQGWSWERRASGGADSVPGQARKRRCKRKYLPRWTADKVVSASYGAPILQGQRHVGPKALRALGKRARKGTRGGRESDLVTKEAPMQLGVFRDARACLTQGSWFGWVALTSPDANQKRLGG